MVDAAAAELGGLDVLVNNAGVFFDHPTRDVVRGVAARAGATRSASTSSARPT